mgnify:CR=1 FL=1
MFAVALRPPRPPQPLLSLDCLYSFTAFHGLCCLSRQIIGNNMRECCEASAAALVCKQWSSSIPAGERAVPPLALFSGCMTPQQLYRAAARPLPVLARAPVTLLRLVCGCMIGIKSLDLDMHSEPQRWASKLAYLKDMMKRLRTCTIHVNTR